MRMAEKLAMNVAGSVVTTGDPVALRRGKGPVAAEPGAGAVGRYDSEMISCVRS